MKRAAFLLLVFFIGAAVFSGGTAQGSSHQGGRLIEVAGEAPVLNQNLARALQDALQSAFRNAVTMVVKGNMAEKDFAAFHEEIENALLRTSEQFVQRYRLLEQKTDPATQRMRVKVEVVVNHTHIDGVLRSLRLQTKNPGEVRVLILVEEEILGREQPTLPLSPERVSTAERRMMVRFGQAGYTPISPRAQRQPAAPGQIAAAVRGNNDAARALGGICRCDLVITARAVAERERSGSYVGLVNGRVLRVSDGAVLAIRSRQVQIRPRGSDSGFNAAISAASDGVALALVAEVRRSVPPRRGGSR
ncbi:MAG: hypothetical protein O2807_03305 [bacterium]|nr:hypothetical protein [bacterium]